MAAVTLALAVSLSGCAPDARKSGADASHSKSALAPGLAGKAGYHAPTVGSCWPAPADHSSLQPDWNVSQDGGPVKCSKPHQLYTAAVVALPGSVPRDEYSQGQFNQDVYTAGEQACVDFIKKNIGTPDDQNGRFEYKSYLPVKKDWAAGARWVRCDLIVFKLGSSIDAPDLENLPSYATLKGQFAAHDFDLCTNVAGGTVAKGPRAAGAVFASCDNAQWTYFHYFSDNNPNPSYPTPAQFKAEFQALCTQFGTASGAHVVPWYPSRQDWADGDQGFECWGTYM